MARITPFLALCVAALVGGSAAKPIVVRDSPVTLPIIRRFDMTALNGQTIVEHDQARARMLVGQAAERARAKVGTPSADPPGTVYPLPVINDVVTYIAVVGVGTPPTFYNLLVDTGSSNTWVGANKSYVQTSSSMDTGETVHVNYGKGSFTGELFTDTVTLGNLVIPNQGIGVARNVTDLRGIDGILGIGPVDLTINTTSGGEAIPTVTSNAAALGLIPEVVVGIYYQPTVSFGEITGELTFGGINSSQFTGDLNAVPITSTFPASRYVGIDQTLSYGNSTLLTSAGITDTGTTLILLRTDAFEQYQRLTGATLDANTGLLRITEAQFNKLQSMFFSIGGVDYEFTANAQIWPRDLNELIGGTAGAIYLIVNDLGTVSAQGLDFIDGFTFLQRFYHVYDETVGAVGIATTRFTNATSN